MEISQTFVENGGIQAGNSYCVESIQEVQLCFVEGAAEGPEIPVALTGNCPMSANLYISCLDLVGVWGDFIFAK